MNEFAQIVARLHTSLTVPNDARIEPTRIRQAAVAVLLREVAGRAEALIIKRAERAGDPWSGHLALPGGRAEAGDVDLLATAARETYEEVGVLVSRESFLGRLPLVITQRPNLPDGEITPFVALAPPDCAPQVSAEVAAVFWVALEDLRCEGRSCEVRFRQGDLLIKRPAYPSEGGPIWGITERILTSLLTLLDENDQRGYR